MGHLPKLIEDLALILIVGAITTLLFRRIKQPLVLGYIIAGLLVGPHLSLTPTVADTENVKTLAEIGARLGRKALAQVATLVKPETILGWHRRLVAKNFDGSKERGGGKIKIRHFHQVYGI